MKQDRRLMARSGSGLRRMAGLVAALVLLALLGPGNGAGAQALHVLKQAQKNQQAATEEAAPTDPGQQSLETLLEPTVRKLVAESLQAEAAAGSATPAQASRPDPFAMLLDKARMGMHGIGQRVDAVAALWPRLGEEVERAFILLTDLEGWPRMWTGILNLAAMLLVGGVVARLVARLFGPMRLAEEGASQGIFGVVSLAGILLFRNLVVLAVFAVSAFLISLLWFIQVDPMRIFLLSALGIVTMTLLGWMIGDMLFAPRNPDRRPVDLSDRASAGLQLWLATVFCISGLAGFLNGTIELLALPAATIDIVQLIGGGLMLAATLPAILAVRADPLAVASVDSPSTDEPETAPPGLLRQVFGRYRRLWLVLALGLYGVLWSFSVLAEQSSKVTAVLILFAAFGLTLYVARLRPLGREAAAAVRLDTAQTAPHLKDPDRDPEDALPGTDGVMEAESALAEPPRSGALGLLPAPTLFVRLVLGLVMAGALLHVIGVDMVALQQSPLGQRATRVVISVLVVLAVASVIWSLVQRTITRFMDRENARALAEAAEHAVDEDGLGGLVVSRFGTLLPLIRGFILTFIATITVMVVLSSMGLDIGPLLAGAGVVGIAIGFGAQALVRDIISGIFFLIDDAFRVGEYVEFGEIRGQVEQISIRSMRLRHHRGAIHTVPFGELRSITNYNRDWAIYKQEFRLPYDTDTEKVRKIIKKVGLKLLEHPELGSKFLQPLKSQGVFKIEEGALILRTKFTCKPREQFLIRKAVFQEVKNALYAAGIELAQRRVQIEWPEWAKDQEDAAEGTPEAPTSAPVDDAQKRAAMAAAGAAGLVVSQQTERPVHPDEP